MRPDRLFAAALLSSCLCFVAGKASLSSRWSSLWPLDDVKNALIIVGVTVLGLGIVVGLIVHHFWFGEGVSGESTHIGNSLVVAEFGYARGGLILTYAVLRS